VQAETLAKQNGRILLLGDMEHGEVNVAGTLDASAPNGGDGGFIDTSAARVAVANEVQVTTSAAHGETGTWLIDPTDFTISAGNDEKTNSGIGAETLNNNLASTSVILETIDSGSEAGDIHVNADISYDQNTLTLNAHNNINLNADINVNGSGTLALNYGGTAGDAAATPAEGSSLNALGGQV